MTDQQILSISIIIPTLNEEKNLEHLAPLLASYSQLEVVISDGGSNDQTLATAKRWGFIVVSGAAGRGAQLNRGAAGASGELLLFLHCDTRLPADFPQQIRAVLRQPGVIAGAFRFAIDASGPQFRLLEWATNLRSTLWQAPYGDQAIFLPAATFHQVGRFPEQALLEDYELIKRLRKTGTIAIAPTAATTSARRWQQLGVVRTTLINQLIIVGYHAGLSPRRLAHFYYRPVARKNP